MCCEALFVIMGLYALFAGKFRLYGKRTIEGDRARLIGVILIAPLAITVCLAVVAGSSGESADSNTYTQLSGLEILLMIAAFILAAVITLTTPEPVSVAAAFPGRQTPYYPPSPAVMTTAEAAAYLRVSEAEVLSLIERGTLPAGKVGDQYRITREALDNFLRQSGGTISGQIF